MSFLNSIWLWGGLAAAGVAVPIVIHLLHQKVRRRTDWAAMELLRRAMIIRSGQVRLEDYLLLVLRCLVLALVAFALARPTLRNWTASRFGQRRVGMVVAIDASYSMAHGKHTKRFDRAVNRALAILATARVGDPATVMLMGERPEMLLRATGYDEQRFRDVLEEAEALPQRLNLDRSLAEAAQLVAELKTPVRECYLVTDAQATDWQSLSDEARASIERITDVASLFVVPVGADGEENLAVTRFEYASGSLAAAGMARFVAKIRNHGRMTHEGGEVTFHVDGQPITRQSLGTIEPGRAKLVTFFTSFDRGGDARLDVSLNPDQLNVDNRRHIVVGVRSRIRVLCVDGEPSSGEDPGETFYLLKALRLKQIGEDATMDAVRTDWQDVGAENFADFDVIVLANVPAVEEDTANRLSRFVDRGGGLVVFAGEKIDVEAYNTRLRHNGSGLLPGELIEAVSADGGAASNKSTSSESASNESTDTAAGDSEGGWRLGPIRSKHILAAVARAVPEQQMATARFQRVMRVRVDGDAVAILSLADRTLPLLLEKRVGRGSVLLVTTTADRRWSNFAVHPLYPMLLQQAVTYLTSRPGEREFAVGEPAHVAVTGQRAGARVTLELPDGDDRSVKLSMLDTGEVICPIETQRPGFYGVVSGEGLASAVAVNVDPVEADVKVMEPAALAEKLGALSAAVIPADANLAAVIKESRHGTEISRTLLILATLAFLLQGYLARRFTRRTSASDTDVMQKVHQQTVAAARRTLPSGRRAG